MFLLIIAAIVFYAAMSLIFFIFSVSEMIENNNGNTAKIIFAAVYSIFWPVTLVVVSTAVFVMRSFRRIVAISG
jgi:hypothetical protein